MQNFSNFLDQIELILNQIKKIDLLGYVNTENEKERLFNNLKTYINSQSIQPTDDELHNDRFIKLTEQSRSLYNCYYSLMETAKCVEIISHPTKNEFNFQSHNNLLSKQELEVMQLKAHSHIAFVGSGPLPWTAIRYHLKTNVNVSCIDYNPEAVFLSYKLLDVYNLHQSVKVFCTDASLFNYADITHIVLAGMALSKDQIIEKVIKTAQTGTMLIIRSSVGLNCFFYENYHLTKNNYFEYKISLSGDPSGELMSYVFVKK